MPINVLPSGPGPLNGLPALSGGDRKGEEVQFDPAFAALLAALVPPVQGLPTGMNATGANLGQQVGLAAGIPTAAQAAAAATSPMVPLDANGQGAFALPTGIPVPTPESPNPLPEGISRAVTLPTSQATRFVEALLAEAAAQGQQPVQVLSVTQGAPPAPMAPSALPQSAPVLAMPTEVLPAAAEVLAAVAPAQAPTASTPARATPAQALATPVQAPATPVQAPVTLAQAPATPVQDPAATAGSLAAATVSAGNRPALLPRPIPVPRAEAGENEPAALEPVNAPGGVANSQGFSGRISGEAAPVTASAAANQKQSRDSDRSLHQSRQPESLNVPVLPPQAPSVDATSDRLATRLPNPVEPGRLVETLPRALADAGPGNYTVTLQLHPEHLGEVKLQVQLIGSQVHTVMEVANAAARQALEANGDQLRQGLTQAGLTLAGFQVSTGQGEQRSREQQAAFAEQLQEGRRVSGVRPRTAPKVEPTRTIRDRTGARIDTLV